MPLKKPVGRAYHSLMRSFWFLLALSCSSPPTNDVAQAAAGNASTTAGQPTTLDGGASADMGGGAPSAGGSVSGAAGVPLTGGAGLATAGNGGASSAGSAGVSSAGGGMAPEAGTGGAAAGMGGDGGQAGAAAGTGGAAECQTVPSKQKCDGCQISVKVCPDVVPVWLTSGGPSFPCFRPESGPDDCGAAYEKAKAWEAVCCGQ